jgi:hypothetical protein
MYRSYEHAKVARPTVSNVPWQTWREIPRGKARQSSDKGLGPAVACADVELPSDGRAAWRRGVRRGFGRHRSKVPLPVGSTVTPSLYRTVPVGWNKCESDARRVRIKRATSFESAPCLDEEDVSGSVYLSLPDMIPVEVRCRIATLKKAVEAGTTPKYLWWLDRKLFRGRHLALHLCQRSDDRVLS